MAGMDYKSCDVCLARTYYDAHLDRDYDEKKWKDGLPHVGDMKVICVECSAKWRIAIVKKKTGKEKK